MNLIWRVALTMEMYNTLTGFDGKFSKEEAKSKKLSEDLMVMSLKKSQLESDKRVLQFKLDLVVAMEADMKAKYEIELKVLKESLKQAQYQKRAVEASQKRAEKAQKLAKKGPSRLKLPLPQPTNTWRLWLLKKINS
ncbi:hypothetical protein Adt_21177 [Abeliophyllum distichum]|uniref:Uncharacterized protein n=1 Tax=Abeliophyllum distichum TaxID=126358 RepID=A0ABD1SYU4_9LAMI